MVFDSTLSSCDCPPRTSYDKQVFKSFLPLKFLEEGFYLKVLNQSFMLSRRVVEEVAPPTCPPELATIMQLATEDKSELPIFSAPLLILTLLKEGALVKKDLVPSV